LIKHMQHPHGVGGRIQLYYFEFSPTPIFVDVE